MIWYIQYSAKRGIQRGLRTAQVFGYGKGVENFLRRDFDRSRFGLVRNRSDFDSTGTVNRKRVYGSVCDQSELSS